MNNNLSQFSLLPFRGRNSEFPFLQDENQKSEGTRRAPTTLSAELRVQVGSANGDANSLPMAPGGPSGFQGQVRFVPEEQQP